MLIIKFIKACVDLITDHWNSLLIVQYIYWSFIQSTDFLIFHFTDHCIYFTDQLNPSLQLSPDATKITTKKYNNVICESANDYVLRSAATHRYFQLSPLTHNDFVVTRSNWQSFAATHSSLQLFAVTRCNPQIFLVIHYDSLWFCTDPLELTIIYSDSLQITVTFSDPLQPTDIPSDPLWLTLIL